MIKMVEEASFTEAIIAGKPSKIMFDTVRKQHGLEHTALSDWIMVGDNPGTDMAFA